MDKAKESSENVMLKTLGIFADGVKSGEIVGIAVIALREDGCHVCLLGESKPMETVYALESLKLKVLSDEEVKSGITQEGGLSN